ncbi:MAG TPA: adenosylcobinamide-GDP ribazoletransferase [Terriglobales bacterium]|nr:adenosylcobinamide-GDP ribazoletransferase [Terriglobales bacterium]
MIVALRFMTRLPFPAVSHTSGSLSRAAAFFPVVGLLVAAGAVGLNKILSGHMDRDLVALVILIYLVVITGGLHEDGLADAADGFGAGWNKEQILAIMRDSRIGSYGAIALTLSLLARYVLLSKLPARNFSAYLIAGHVLCRWTTLPLSFFLRPAREENGQGAQVAQRISAVALAFGTFFTLAICYWALHKSGWIPVAATLGVTLLSGLYYRSQIGGVTGDCYGATNQLTEIVVYFCGVLAG